MNLPLNTDLTGKVAVITGAAGTLCSVFSKALAASGAKVALLGRTYANVQKLADEITAIEDTLKANMQRQGVDTIEAGKHTVRWAVVKSSRFDSKAFSAAHPALYSEYAKRRREETRYTITPDGLDYPGRSGGVF